ncbi:hypothetical protein F4774DRAFT_384919 [Daldinia eschscholtzii]|nr:hypothetical protein F4774DRAFT_384919 [Daldinia eschscholtzii]
MRTYLLIITSLLLPTVLSLQSGCAGVTDCKACGWYCNQGCSAPLVDSECNRCLYCRRESSSCSFEHIGDTWTHDPPSKELCAACDEGCWCHGDWYCMDNATGPPPPSPPTTTPRGTVAGATNLPVVL